jgi:hypothetical protein
MLPQLPDPYPTLDRLISSDGFRSLVSKLTGVPDLKFDPHYFGGGTHENRHGQGLDPHIDFNHHPVTDQHRRLNLIIYLNDEWQSDWGGNIDLHQDPYLPPALDEIKSYPPLFNHCVIFETNEYSWHGFTRINLPEDKRHLTRKSVALYYYTDDRPADKTGPHHSTVYVERHLPPEIGAGTTLSEEQYQLVQGMMNGRDQHLKRLYGYIADLSERLHQTSAPANEILDVDEGSEPDLRGLMISNAVLAKELEELKQSRSWLITAPLRWISTRFRRSPGKSVGHKIRPCPVCGDHGRKLRVLGEVPQTQDGNYSSKEFRLALCRRSDLVYLDPLPTEDDFNIMYGMGQFDSSEYTEEERVASMMEYYSHCIKQHFAGSNEESFTLLEIGAGMAWVSKALKQINASASTLAQDISDECASRCDWVDKYFIGSVDEFCQSRSQKINAISLTHVIEHLPDPVATLKTLASMLEAGGSILVTAPLRPTGWKPKQGIGPWLEYSYLHVPAHINYFSQTSLTEAAEQAGLVVSHWDGSSEDSQAFEAVLRRS